MVGKNNRDKVAALAGVSSATVSRVYNNPGRVSRSRKEAVLRAAKELGYSPDKSASALRRKGTGQISLVSFEKKNRSWYWGNTPTSKWFFTDALYGILSVVEPSMYRLSVKTLKSTEEIRLIKWEKECDGVLFYDVDEQQEAITAASLKVPSVISHHTSQFIENHFCSTDNCTGGSLTAKHLKEQGYQHPVYISYHPELIVPNHDRYKGFNSGWKGEVPLIPTDPGKEGGYKAAESLISEIRGGRIDSIAVVNDLTAIGVIQCLQNHHILPGKDVGLIAYDNMPLNYVLPFSLSSVDLKPAVLYREAAEMLLSLIIDPDHPVENRIIFPALIPGDSTAAGN